MVIPQMIRAASAAAPAATGRGRPRGRVPLWRTRVPAMHGITEPGRVAEQYGDESLLQTRRSVWRDSVDGRNPQDSAAAAVRATSPARVLEVGCGTGMFAARLARENPHAAVTATDLSERFVAMTAERGVAAQRADVQELPFPDGDAHLAGLLRSAGVDPLVTQFSAENGAAVLRRHFAEVTREDITTRAVF